MFWLSLFYFLRLKLAKSADRILQLHSEHSQTRIVFFLNWGKRLIKKDIKPQYNERFGETYFATENNEISEQMIFQKGVWANFMLFSLTLYWTTAVYTENNIKLIIELIEATDFQEVCN